MLAQRLTLIDDLAHVVRETVPCYNVRLRDVRVGVFYTGVHLSTGEAGVAYSCSHEVTTAVCCPKAATKMQNPGELTGTLLADALRMAHSPNPLQSAVGIAAINAASNPLILRSAEYASRIRVGTDALDLVQLRPSDVVTMIGAFTPYVRQLRPLVRTLHVVDRNVSALVELGVEPEGQPALAKVLPASDVVVITGSAIVNHSIEEVLELASSAREIVVVGPTASMWPAPLFERGVTIIGGVCITNSDLALRIVGEGGAGQALMEHCAERYALRCPTAA